MKQLRRILSILLILVVGLVVYSFVQLGATPKNPIQIGLNLLYFISILAALIGLRFSLIGNQRMHPIVVVLTIALVAVSTWEWLDPQSILTTGHLSLGLFALQFGLVLMLMVKSQDKWSKMVQFVLGVTTIMIASFAFLKLENGMYYTIGGLALILSVISTLIYLIARKVN